MPRIPSDTLELCQLTGIVPMGGDWFDSFDEAKAHAGDGYTVCIREQDINIFGSYASQQEYLDTAGSYLESRAKRTADDLALLRETFPETYEFPIESVNALNLPAKGRWFLTEVGARGALALQGAGVIDNVRIEHDPEFRVWSLYPSDDEFLSDILTTWPEAAIDYAEPAHQT